GQFMITIIDLGISNIKSITRGFITQGFRVRVTTDPDDVRSAESLVLPGVGAFPRAMEVLREKGLDLAIKEHVLSGKPLLGICLGMQLLFNDSSEHIRTQGLGLMRGHVMRFPNDRPVPHMGWNEVIQIHPSLLLKGVPDRADFYFVHSYYAVPDDDRCIIGESDHYGRFVAAVQDGVIFGTQFHPEKSQRYGLLLLRNFASITERT
ncbi:MAG: imidazole glycerol phosphate synthase subunit HisH, partial [Spirochaetota bacterium]